MFKPRKFRDPSYRVWKEKEEILSLVPTSLLHLVSLSTWESGIVEKSKIFKHFPLTQISNGVDMSVFSRRNKQEAKRLLGIPEERVTLMLVAEFLDTEYKGTSIAFEALSGLRDPGRFYLLIVGKISAVPDIHIDFHCFGKVSDRKNLSVIYNAADIFIFPSLFETFGRTFLEAMACGAAFAGFSSGGAGDLIENGRQGYISEVKNSLALRECIEHCCTTAEKLANLQYQAEERAKEYEISMVADKYLELYRKCISDNQNTFV